MNLVVLAEVHEHSGSFLHEYRELLTNPGHIAFELTMEVATVVAAVIVGKVTHITSRIFNKMVHKHDIEKHGHKCTDE